MAAWQGAPPASILVVEDDRPALDMLCQMMLMRYPQSNIYPAADGRAGIEEFKRHAPDLVITDINMPVMNGIEMAEAIRSLDPEAQFIVLTAYNEESYQERFREIGCCAFLLKPVDLKTLFSLVDGCLLNSQPIESA